MPKKDHKKQTRRSEGDKKKKKKKGRKGPRGAAMQPPMPSVLPLRMPQPQPGGGGYVPGSSSTPFLGMMTSPAMPPMVTPTNLAPQAALDVNNAAEMQALRRSMESMQAAMHVPRSSPASTGDTSMVIADQYANSDAELASQLRGLDLNRVRVDVPPPGEREVPALLRPDRLPQGDPMHIDGQHPRFTQPRMGPRIRPGHIGPPSLSDSEF